MVRVWLGALGRAPPSVTAHNPGLEHGRQGRGARPQAIKSGNGHREQKPKKLKMGKEAVGGPPGGWVPQQASGLGNLTSRWVAVWVKHGG